MTATISRLFDNYSTAQQAVRDLEAAGIPVAEISIVASNADGWYAPDPGPRAGGTPAAPQCSKCRKPMALVTALPRVTGPCSVFSMPGL
jgi:hypothetical protein